MNILNTDEQLIYTTRTINNEAIANHDIEILTSCWLDDIVIVRGNGNIILNKAEAKKVWQKIFDTQPGISFLRNPEQIIINKDGLLAWENGKWKGINTYSSGGNYAAMWKKQSDEWKIQAELFVSLE